jgi:hypothetical protein
MERGNLAGASDAVLEGIAGALQLDDAERAHLFDLARAAQPAPPRQRRMKTSGVTDGIGQVLDAITDAPAWVRNASWAATAERTETCPPTHSGRNSPRFPVIPSRPELDRPAPGGIRTIKGVLACLAQRLMVVLRGRDQKSSLDGGYPGELPEGPGWPALGSTPFRGRTERDWSVRWAHCNTAWYGRRWRS